MTGTNGVRMVAEVSAEPSMEEILSSIKRIIAEEGEAPPRSRRPLKAAAAASTRPLPDLEPASDQDDEDEVLELSDPMPAASPPPREPLAADPVRSPDRAAPERPAIARGEPILSTAAAEATRGSLESLSRLMVKPEPASDGSLEGLVRDMLRPMLREWLDTHLPDMVEAMVAREIAKITGQPR